MAIPLDVGSNPTASIMNLTELKKASQPLNRGWDAFLLCKIWQIFQMNGVKQIIKKLKFKFLKKISDNL